MHLYTKAKTILLCYLQLNVTITVIINCIWCHCCRADQCHHLKVAIVKV